jgi:hypothetical protein
MRRTGIWHEKAKKSTVISSTLAPGTSTPLEQRLAKFVPYSKSVPKFAATPELRLVSLAAVIQRSQTPINFRLHHTRRVQ